LNDLRQQRILAALPHPTAAIGRWLWCLEEARHRTLQRIEGLQPRLVDWEAPESGNSVGTVLYHIAAIELDYLYADLLGQPFPPDVVERFPYEVREDSGHLTPVRKFDMDWYLQRLTFAHDLLLKSIQSMDLDDFRRARHLTDRPIDITPEWTLFHLTQHEAEHRGELASIRMRAEASRSS
jgi:uncharacterized damage-inducible protein DinB